MKSLFEIAKSGLSSARRSMSVTSNNITNASTDGYSRQRLQKSPAGMQKSNTYAGLGVNVDDVVRLRDEMTDRLLNSKQQDMGYLKKKNEINEKLEAIMVSDSGVDLDGRISRLFDNFSDLASNPQDVSLRNNLLNESRQFTGKMKSLSRNIDELSKQVKGFAEKSIDKINTLLSDIDKLNDSITQGEARGQSNLKSLDKRVQRMNELSKLIDFKSTTTDSGAVRIRIGGRTVLDEHQAHQLEADVDDGNQIFRLRMENGHLIEAQGGSLGAEIEMFEEGIPDLKSKLDNIASTVVEDINSLHRSGYGLEDNVNRDFFVPTGDTADTIEVNQAIEDNPSHIAASSVAGEEGNGEIASKIAALRNDKIIGDTSENRRLTDYAIGVISEPGSQVNSLNSSIEARETEIQMLEKQQQQTAGVNVDEELGRMIKFQNAYQGAAKVMSSAQKMYDTLISIVR